MERGRIKGDSYLPSDFKTGHLSLHIKDSSDAHMVTKLFTCLQECTEILLLRESFTTKKV